MKVQIDIDVDQISLDIAHDMQEKYKVTKINVAIFGSNNFIQFGGCCFRICNNCTTVNTNYINDGKNYYDIPNNFGLTGGNKNFTISSYEVYQIEY